MGLNVTDKAHCVSCGFHCAENPLDCLTYYSNLRSAEYYIVDAGGDVHEDGKDTKIACTELSILKKLTVKELFLHGLVFMAKHPNREWSCNVSRDRASAHGGYTVVRGLDPIACGAMGDILAFAKEKEDGTVVQVSLVEVDGKNIMPNRWYDTNLTERELCDEEK